MMPSPSTKDTDAAVTNSEEWTQKAEEICLSSNRIEGACMSYPHWEPMIAADTNPAKARGKHVLWQEFMDA